jgi:hypothetical protein
MLTKLCLGKALLVTHRVTPYSDHELLELSKLIMLTVSCGPVAYCEQAAVSSSMATSMSLA